MQRKVSASKRVCKTVDELELNEGNKFIYYIIGDSGDEPRMVGESVKFDFRVPQLATY